MNSFFCKTRILSGPGSCSFLKTLGARRLFLVTDPYFSGSGLAEKLDIFFAADRLTAGQYRELTQLLAQQEAAYGT